MCCAAQRIIMVFVTASDKREEHTHIQTINIGDWNANNNRLNMNMVVTNQLKGIVGRYFPKTSKSLYKGAESIKNVDELLGIPCKRSNLVTVRRTGESLLFCITTFCWYWFPPTVRLVGKPEAGICVLWMCVAVRFVVGFKCVRWTYWLWLPLDGVGVREAVALFLLSVSLALSRWMRSGDKRLTREDGLLTGVFVAGCLESMWLA